MRCALNGTKTRAESSEQFRITARLHTFVLFVIEPTTTTRLDTRPSSFKRLTIRSWPAPRTGIATRPQTTPSWQPRRRQLPRRRDRLRHRVRPRRRVPRPQRQCRPTFRPRRDPTWGTQDAGNGTATCPTCTAITCSYRTAFIPKDSSRRNIATDRWKTSTRSEVRCLEKVISMVMYVGMVVVGGGEKKDTI